MALPDVVAQVAGGSELRHAWTNELGGQTFELPGRQLFAKWAPPGPLVPALHREAARLRWAAPHVVVPVVVDLVTGDDGSAVLLTRALPGSSAVVDRWKADPGPAVRAIGEGLRAMHDALPVEACPFSWSVVDRLAAGRRLDPAGWHPCHRHLAAEEAVALVAAAPEVDRLVVCHGDACAPNTLVADDGRCAGRVDLADLGVADRWADLAVATWSTEWNFGPGWEDALLASYGIGRDEERIRYYRLLWDLTG